MIASEHIEKQYYLHLRNQRTFGPRKGDLGVQANMQYSFFRLPY